MVCRHLLYNSGKDMKHFSHLFTESSNVCIKLLFIINMNTKKFLDLCIIDELNFVFFFSSLELRIRWHLSEFIFVQLFENYSNSFSAHICSLLRSNWRLLSQKYGVLSSSCAVELTFFVRRTCLMYFYWKVKVAVRIPWGRPF